MVFVTILDRYFPEKAGFRLFGDPFERKREDEERTKRLAAAQEARQQQIDAGRQQVNYQ